MLIVAASGCVRDEAPTTGSTHTAGDSSVLHTVESYYLDLSARDWPAFARHFWPGATIATLWDADGSGTPSPFATTVAEFIRQAPDGPDSKPIFAERLLDAEVRTFGDLALVWARYEARFGDSTAVEVWTGVDAFSLLRHSGDWRIASLTFVPEASGGDLP